MADHNNRVVRERPTLARGDGAVMDYVQEMEAYCDELERMVEALVAKQAQPSPKWATASVAMAEGRYAQIVAIDTNGQMWIEHPSIGWRRLPDVPEEGA